MGNRRDADRLHFPPVLGTSGQMHLALLIAQARQARGPDSLSFSITMCHKSSIDIQRSGHHHAEGVGVRCTDRYFSSTREYKGGSALSHW